MGDEKDDARNPSTLYGQQLAARIANYSQAVGNRYGDVKEEEEEDYEEDLAEVEEEDGDDRSNGVHMVKDAAGSEDDDSENDDDDDDEDEEEEEEEGGEDRDDKPKGYGMKVEDVDIAKHPKKRKMKSLVSSYEFAPRVPVQPPPPHPPPTSTPLAVPRPSSGGRNSLTDWTERETFTLLDAWGERFLQRGRKSLRFEEWREVVEKVAEVSKIERSDTQCRNRLDTLKKKYKKEKASAVPSKWIYFKKMDMLISSPPPQQPEPSRGLLDSGGYAFTNPRVILNSANGLDRARDSPDDSESTEGDNDSDGLPPKKRKSGRDNDEGSPVRLLADCIHKFSAMYEKIESSKRQQMAELEKMRMDFIRDMEMQKRRIMEKAQAEIAKIWQERNGKGSG